MKKNDFIEFIQEALVIFFLFSFPTFFLLSLFGYELTVQKATPVNPQQTIQTKCITN